MRGFGNFTVDPGSAFKKHDHGEIGMVMIGKVMNIIWQLHDIFHAITNDTISPNH